MSPRSSSLLRRLVGMVLVAGLASCADTTAPMEVALRFQVAPDSVDCFGAHGPQRCLSVRELVGGDAWGGWLPFYEPIEGFAHEPGYTYDVLVARRSVPQPPADGSSWAYRLLQLLARTPSPG